VAVRSRHEISSPAQTLGSRVRIPLEAWMYIRASSVLVLSCLGSGLATGLISRPRSPTNCLYDPYFQMNSDWKQARGLNTKCIIKFNSYLFTCKLNSPKANYKVSTTKEKETKHMQTKYKSTMNHLNNNN
jgi:hypothetical protein